MTITAPSIITQPFAYDGDLDPLPSTDIDPNVANQQTGYPPIQSQPLNAGGEPFTREQTNGIFNYYTNIIRWQNVGGTFTFDSAVSTDLGGYNLGAILAYTRSNGTLGFLSSTINNNTNNFITNPSVIGNQWVDTVQGFYPSIVENISTGDVTIGNRVGGATYSISSFSSTNIDYNGEIILFQDDNGYMNIGLQSAIDSTQSLAQLNLGFIDSGGGYLPQTVMQTQYSDSSTYRAKFLITPSSNAPGYLGFQSVIQNFADIDNYVDFQMYPDSSNNPFSYWTNVISGTQNTGLSMSTNYRLQHLGDLNTLATSPISLAVLGDITTALTNYATLTNINTSYAYNDGSWVITGLKIGTDPRRGMVVSGKLTTTINVGVNNFSLNIVSLGWLLGSTSGSVRPANGSLSADVLFVGGYASYSSFSGILNLYAENSSGAGVYTIYFSIVI